jgi:hypothetical protein
MDTSLIVIGALLGFLIVAASIYAAFSLEVRHRLSWPAADGTWRGEENF